MNGDSENAESSLGGFLQTVVRPLRDLESNWTVDLAKNLEEYLLKICSGQISSEEDAIFTVNFAEAALLLQGSVQVYSRKVEYLYSLVLHTLTFISQKSQEDQDASPSARSDSGAHSTKNEEDDQFWGLDDIPVDSKNLLGSSTFRDTPPGHFVRPPANLVVLEGECLDATGDAGELESYLLATSDLYRDFILLDSCDAVAVDCFLDSKDGEGPSNAYRGSSVISKGRKSFLSPSRQSGGTAQKSAKKKNDANQIPSPCVDQRFEPNDCNIGCSSPAFDFPDGNDGFGTGDAYSEPGDFDDEEEDDPWKPLNPHAPGNLKVRPYKKVKPKTRLDIGSRKHQSLAVEFPLAKLNGLISTELTKIWEERFRPSEKVEKSQYEKLRESLVLRETEANDAFDSPNNNTEDNGYDSDDQDFGPPDFNMPDVNTFNDNSFNPEEVPPPPYQEKGDDPNANLEDLCRSHLDALLATLAENEKQTELAARVSTWKQRIEQNLEEQDARPPFDIHKYGEKVLNKLSAEGADESTLSFTDVVKGQPKHDVARTFSALLQLVNNGDVDLVRSNSDTTPICHSDDKPFYVRLLKNEKKKGFPLQPSKKRAKSPLIKGHAKEKSRKGKENCSDVNTSPQGSNSSCRFSVKGSQPRCTPEGKKRRKSRLIAPLEMHFVG